LPTWRGAVVEAVHTDGRITQVGANPVSLRGIVRFALGGHAVTVKGTNARAVPVTRQSTAPQPGPTLVIGLGNASTVTARISVR